MSNTDLGSYTFCLGRCYLRDPRDKCYNSCNKQYSRTPKDVIDWYNNNIKNIQKYL